MQILRQGVAIYLTLIFFILYRNGICAGEPIYLADIFLDSGIWMVHWRYNPTYSNHDKVQIRDNKNNLVAEVKFPQDLFRLEGALLGKRLFLTENFIEHQEQARIASDEQHNGADLALVFRIVFYEPLIAVPFGAKQEETARLIFVEQLKVDGAKIIKKRFVIGAQFRKNTDCRADDHQGAQRQKISPGQERSSPGIGAYRRRHGGRAGASKPALRYT